MSLTKMVFNIEIKIYSSNKINKLNENDARKNLC